MKFLAWGAVFFTQTKTIVSRKWLFLMKLSCLFIPAFFLSANLLMARPSKAQDLEKTKVTVCLKNESLKSALGKLEHQTAFRFAYIESQIALYDNLTMNKKTRTLRETLELLFAGTRLHFIVKNNNIIILEGERPEHAAVNEEAKTGNKATDEAAGTNESDLPVLSGKVVNEKGEPIPGATITVKGSSVATSTGEDGTFKLNVPSSASILVVSSVGYLTREIVAGSEPFLTIKLTASVSGLDDIVVVGYGQQKKVSLTGAVSSITGAQVATTRSESVVNMLSGKIPGVRVVQNTSEPGAFSNSFDIRGLGNPLVIIDGVPMPVTGPTAAGVNT